MNSPFELAPGLKLAWRGEDNINYAIELKERVGVGAWQDTEGRLWDERHLRKVAGLPSASTVKPVDFVGYSHSRYTQLIENTFAEIKKLSELKGGEYSGDTDRLANFRRNAAALGLTQEQVWAVYAAKHWDAVMQFVKDLGEGKERKRLESLAGRCDDLIVYLLLFKAMLEERDMDMSRGD